MSAFLLVIIVALFGGDAIAGEASWGNLRFLLMRPIGRGRLLVAKFVVAVFSRGSRGPRRRHAALVAGGIASAGTRSTSPLENGHLTLIHQSIGTLLSTSGRDRVRLVEPHRASSRSRFMVSCMTDSPAGAIFAGVGLYFTSQILDAIEPLGSHPLRAAHPLLRRVAQPHLRGPRGRLTWAGRAAELGYVLLFVGLSVWWFRRKDILS